MTPRDDFKVLLSVAIAGVVSLGAAVPLILLLDRGIGPALRGTDWDWLSFPVIVVLVCGTPYLWWKIYSAVVGWLDKRIG